MQRHILLGVLTLFLILAYFPSTTSAYTSPSLSVTPNNVIVNSTTGLSPNITIIATTQDGHLMRVWMNGTWMNGSTHITGGMALSNFTYGHATISRQFSIGNYTLIATEFDYDPSVNGSLLLVNSTPVTLKVSPPPPTAAISVTNTAEPLGDFNITATIYNGDNVTPYHVALLFTNATGAAIYNTTELAFGNDYSQTYWDYAFLGMVRGDTYYVKGTFYDANNHYLATTNVTPIIVAQTSPFVVTITGSSDSVAYGGIETFSAGTYDGTGPYTYTWYQGKSCTGTPLAAGSSPNYTTAPITSGYTTSTSANGTFSKVWYCVSAKDSSGDNATTQWWIYLTNVPGTAENARPLLVVSPTDSLAAPGTSITAYPGSNVSTYALTNVTNYMEFTNISSQNLENYGIYPAFERLGTVGSLQTWILTFYVSQSTAPGVYNCEISAWNYTTSTSSAANITLTVESASQGAPTTATTTTATTTTIATTTTTITTTVPTTLFTTTPTTTVPATTTISATQSFTLNFSPGWNLISLPFMTITGHASTCAGSLTAWTYSSSNNSYVRRAPNTDFDRWDGAWVYVPDSCALTLVGTPYPATKSLSQELSPGWNLIGVPLNIAPISIDSMKGTCSITAGPYGYNTSLDRYVRSGELLPGKGYFVYVNNACALSLSAQSAPPAPPS